MAASAERFKVVASMQGDQWWQRNVLNQQKSISEDKLQEKEALAATQGMKIKQLESICDELDKRIRAMEALRMSDREAAERQTRRGTGNPRAAG